MFPRNDQVAILGMQTPHISRHPMSTRPVERRGTLVLLAIAYLVFVIYGSLVPLNFRPLPLELAVEEFRQIRDLDLGIGSRADWVANILLFVPLAFLWVGALGAGRKRWIRIAASVSVLGGCVLLSAAIEFVQIFFPPRTVSVNDLRAESIGAVVGIGLWWWGGVAVWSWACRFPLLRGERAVAENVLWAYLALFCAYSLLPLDLTISPVEIYHKWSEGRIRLVPFGQLPANAAEMVYELVTDVLVWVPVSLLWVRSGRVSRRQAVGRTLAAALILELMQVFVYSRVTDATDVFTALAGAVSGSRLGRSRASSAGVPTVRLRGGAGWSVLSFVVALVVVCIVFWYPFDFTTERAVLRERLPLLYGVPFRAYYYGTEFRAVTEVLHKFVFFVPVGVSLGWIGLHVRGHLPTGVWAVLSVAVIAATALVIELGKVALRNKHPDSANLIFAFLGGVAGYAGTVFAVERSGRPVSRRDGAT